MDKLSIIWKSDLTDKMKRSTWTQTKRLEKKVDGNYTRMLRAILNKFLRQHPTQHQLYDHLPPITKTLQVRRIKHAGYCWRSIDELICDVLLWTPSMQSVALCFHKAVCISSPSPSNDYSFAVCGPLFSKGCLYFFPLSF